MGGPIGERRGRGLADAPPMWGAGARLTLRRCPGLSGEDLRARAMRSAPEPPERSSSRRARSAPLRKEEEASPAPPPDVGRGHSAESDLGCILLYVCRRFATVCNGFYCVLLYFASVCCIFAFSCCSLLRCCCGEERERGLAGTPNEGRGRSVATTASAAQAA